MVILAKTVVKLNGMYLLTLVKMAATHMVSILMRSSAKMESSYRLLFKNSVFLVDLFLSSFFFLGGWF